MLRFITSRFLQSLLALFLVITATFFMVRFVPGGPFTAEKAVTPEILRNLEAHYGLDKPLGQQYLDYLGSLARGDLGPSFKYPNRTVNEIIFDKVPVSAELGSISLAVALVLGIGLGTLAAIRRNTWVDYVASSFGMIGISIPTFVVGPLLVLALAIHLGWFNASGWYGPADRVLPALVLGIAYAAPISRLTRGGLLEVLNQDFIRTARAKGLSQRATLWRHVLRNAMIPVVTVMGLQFANLLAGTIVVENVFYLPGLGRLIFQSIANRDLIVVRNCVMLLAAMVILVNFVVDVLYAVIDPRVKASDI